MIKRWVQFLAWAICAAAVLSGCGKEADPLKISLQIPAGETDDLFWFGVEKKLLQVKQGEEALVHVWEPSLTLAWKLKEGDQLTFRGVDSQDRLLVTGEAVVSEAKSVSIPLRRVLY